MARDVGPSGSHRVRSASKCRVIVLSSPKGGTGKTTFAANFLALAARDGFKTIGVDFDPQGTLEKWARRREMTAGRKTGIPIFDLMPAPISHWQQVLKTIQDYEVAVLDMLPSVDHCLLDVHGICEAADIVVVPTGATMNDLDSTMPWLSELNRLGFRASACLNRANRREVFFEAARAQLNRIGHLCPVEVRQLSDAHVPHIDGLSASDKPKSKAAADFAAVWDYVRRELGIVERAAA